MEKKQNCVFSEIFRWVTLLQVLGAVIKTFLTGGMQIVTYPILIHYYNFRLGGAICRPSLYPQDYSLPTN